MKNLPWWLKLELLCAILLLIPIWHFAYLPLNDLPNHLASVHLLLQYYSAQPTYIEPNQNFFTGNSSAFIFLQIFGQAFGLTTAARILLSIIILLMPLSLSWFFFSIDKRLAPMGIVGCAITYNWFFVMGFLNFILSIPLFFFAAGTWLFIREKKASAIELATFAILSLLLLFTHLFGAAALCTLMVSKIAFDFFASGAKFSDPKKIQTADLFAIPLALICLAFAFIYLSGGGQSSIIWSSAQDIAYLFVLYPLSLLLYLCIIVLAIYAFLDRKSFEITNCKTALFWASEGILFCIFAIIFPLSTQSWQFISVRFWPFALIFFLTAFFSLICGSKRFVKEVFVAFFVFSLIAGASVFFGWESMQTQIADIVNAGNNFQSNSSVFAFGRGFAKLAPIGPPSSLLHTPGYWVIEKDIYYPYLFSGDYSPIEYKNSSEHGKEQMSVLLDDLAYAVFSKEAGESECVAWKQYYQKINWTILCAEYDYLAFRESNCEDELTFSSCFEQIEAKPPLYIYKNIEKN
ncbi:MAG: hypothetical protein WC492_00570 [Candidatus Micrarchaeia archaeon]